MPWRRSRAARERWRLRLADHWAVPVGLNNGVLLVATYDAESRLVALDAATGAVRWRSAAYDMVRSTVAAGVLAVPHPPAGVRTVDLDTGQVRWDARTGPLTQVLAVSGNAVAWASPSAAGCLDLATGTSRWSGTHPEVRGFKGEQAHSVAVSGDVVVVSVQHTDAPIDDRQPLPASVYTTTATDMVTGRVLWTRDRVPYLPGVFSTPEGIEVVDVADGSVRWQAPLPPMASGTQVVAAGGNLVVTTAGGLRALRADSGTAAWRVSNLSHAWAISAAGPAHLVVRERSNEPHHARLVDGAGGAEVFRIPVQARSAVLSDGRWLYASLDQTDVAAFAGPGG